jgi:S1-C subfamily serine protease
MNLPWDRSPATPEWVPGVVPGYGGLEQESIALRYGRPVLAIHGGETELKFEDPDSETWKRRLQASALQIAPGIASIGRIEVKNHPSGFDYMGTGWVIDDGIIVTNRHVAQTFAERTEAGFSFSIGFDRVKPIGVDIDFLEEIGSDAAREYLISQVLYIARKYEPDVAFLKFDQADQRLPFRPIGLLGERIPVKTMVATVGYPARDPYLPDQELMERIFGKIYDKKRLAPGFVTDVSAEEISHDCTTLGGNSGSPLIDLATGKVVGLHFQGGFLMHNSAVPAAAVSDLLHRFRNEQLLVLPQRDVKREGDEMPKTESGDKGAGGLELKVTIPLEISVRIGQPVQSGGPGQATDALRVSALPSAGDTRRAANVQEAVVEAKRLLGSRRIRLEIQGWMDHRRACCRGRSRSEASS